MFCVAFNCVCRVLYSGHGSGEGRLPGRQAGDWMSLKGGQWGGYLYLFRGDSVV